ncbi:MAG TPA: radical SAM protein [Smithellaceae bacterium]|nr:radical SAM protein [Smithellaceae bacterium]
MIIPVFIMNSGCPHRCIFCNQEITAGNFPRQITEDFLVSEVNAYLKSQKHRAAHVEIAFYGGSFTAIAGDYQEKLLSWAHDFIKKGLVDSLRISTRPDCISSDSLLLLKKYGVSTVEIGAQSFVDEVLDFARRGHRAADTGSAIMLLKQCGFKTGIHLMAGLPKDTREGFLFSVNKTIELKPDTVRIHPVFVLRDTPLAKEYESGNYRPLSLAEAVDYCACAQVELSASGIRVIRTGLHITPEMKDGNSVLAGPVHPSFGALVRSSIFYHQITKQLASLRNKAAEITFNVASGDISDFRGLKNSNMRAIKKLYPDACIMIKSNPEQKRGIISVEVDGKFFSIAEISGIV